MPKLGATVLPVLAGTASGGKPTFDPMATWLQNVAKFLAAIHAALLSAERSAKNGIFLGGVENVGIASKTNRQTNTHPEYDYASDYSGARVWNSWRCFSKENIKIGNC